MTKQRYLDLRNRYFEGVVYNNDNEYVPIGFFTAIGDPISELEFESDVQKFCCGPAVYYRVYDPDIRESGA